MHITVIAKAPVPGRVKTRLCPPCTHDEAAQLAAAALADTLDAIDVLHHRVGRRDLRRVLLLDGEAPSWTPRHYDVVAQSEGDLGRRLACGFEVLGPGIVIGMETPHAVGGLAEGLTALSEGHNMLGPALDGGYWSIGLADTGPGVAHAAFDGVEMSTSHTGAQQLARLHALGRPVTLLEPARDIDTFDDVVALAATGQSGRACALATLLVDRHTPHTPHAPLARFGPACTDQAIWHTLGPVPSVVADHPSAGPW